MRRTILSLAIWLAIGAMLTVAVAWASVAFSPATRARARGFDTGRWRAPVPSDWSPYAEMLFVERGFGIEQGRGVGVLRSPGAPGIAAQAFVVAGWPWHAMAAQRRCTGMVHLHSADLDDAPGPLRSPRSWREGFPLPRDGSWAGTVDGRCLPTHVLCRGFLADTAVFGLLPWALLTVLRVVRRLRRRRSGRCVACGYSLAGGSCAECGRTFSAPPPPAGTSPRSRPRSAR